MSLRRWSLIPVALVLALLTACGAPAAAPAPTVAPAPTAVPAPTAAPEPTTEPTATAAPEPTAAPAPTEAPAPTATPEPAASTGPRTFQIVADQSEATYEVQELFLRQNTPFRPIGRTNAIEGEFQVNADGTPGGQVTRVVVDLRTLKTDSDRRDSAIRERWLESDKFPFAEFISTDALNLPASYTEGQEVTFQLVGDMKIRDVTKQVTFDVVGKLEGNTVTGNATTKILMTDFGFQPPDIAGFVSVENEVTVTITFTATEVQ